MLHTSLNERGQTPGVALTIRQKLVIVRSLDFLGIDAIEVGRPGVSRDIDEFITEVKGEQFKAEMIVHARACCEDVETALDTGISRIEIILGPVDLQLDQPAGTSLDQVVRRVYRAVEEVTENGRKARLSIDDAARTDMNILIELCKAAIDAGADSISLPDIAGIATPDRLRSVFLCVRGIFPTISLHARCHNGHGRALANTLAAMEGGAGCIHVVVDGIGERTGVTSLYDLAMVLKVGYGINTVDLRSVNDISCMVMRFTGVPLPSNRPVLGEINVSCKPGFPATAALDNPQAYERVGPSISRLERPGRCMK